MPDVSARDDYAPAPLWPSVANLSSDAGSQSAGLRGQATGLLLGLARLHEVRQALGGGVRLLLLPPHRTALLCAPPLLARRHGLG